MKKNRFSHYLLGNDFFNDLLITFRNYYYAKSMFLTFLIWLIFFRFLSQSTEILIASKFWLVMYVPYHS